MSPLFSREKEFPDLNFLLFRRKGEIPPSTAAVNLLVVCSWQHLESFPLEQTGFPELNMYMKSKKLHQVKKFKHCPKYQFFCGTEPLPRYIGRCQCVPGVSESQKIHGKVPTRLTAESSAKLIEDKINYKSANKRNSRETHTIKGHLAFNQQIDFFVKRTFGKSSSVKAPFFFLVLKIEQDHQG